MKIRWAFHIYHNSLADAVVEPGISGRRDYIRRDKDPSEIPLRLRLLKLVKLGGLSRSDRVLLQKLHLQESDYSDARRLVARLHKKQCLRCPWDGYTIFTHWDQARVRWWLR